MKQQLNYTPTKDLVVIIPSEAEVTKGGIALPETLQKKPSRGIVVAVGPGVDKLNGPTVGDSVLYGKASGFDVDVDDVIYKMMPEKEVLLILKK